MLITIHTMALLPGETIKERYRVLSLLGQGPYGSVYRVWDKLNQQEYALKEYLDPSAEAQKKFQRQANQLSALDHPKLPKTRDVFTIPNIGQYLVTDYVPGVNLQELLQQYGPLPSERVVEWLQAVCRPLAYLHEKKQLHLNLKPANIRLTPQGEVFLVDSGLPALGVAPGTAGFAAPEQRKQEAVDTLSDIYSLGATLYTLLTNKTPAAALQRESGLATLVSARDVNPNVPPYLSIVANRAMSLRPDARFQSLDEFTKALTNPLGTPSLASAEPRRTPHALNTPFPKTVEPHRRVMPTRTIWGLVTILLITVITLVSLILLDREELVGGSVEAATATTQSQIISVLTSVAPTTTPTPLPTLIPTPTPAPILSQTGMRMLYVPGGVFRYGNDEGDPDEGPSQLINMDAFYIDETEVTNGQYAQCVEDGACRPPTSNAASYHPAYFGAADYDDYPVVFVDWYAADAFCEWRDARLPTEAEWERAAGYDPILLQRTLYSWGDEFDGTALNYCDANCIREGNDFVIDDGHRDTAPVASYENGRSPIGAYDMLGNVMEWVADWYERDYYAEAPKTNPRGPATGEFKALRGGSWFSRAEELTITRRGFFDPTVSRATLGFRCAMDLP